MRARAVVLAAALVLAPLGARAADLVVWWDKGFYPRRTRRSRKSSLPLSRRAASRSRSASIRRESIQDRSAALKTGQPPDFAFGLAI